MKRFGIVFFAIVAIVACLVGCSQETVGGNGILQIEIGSDVSRGLQAISMDTASYNVSVKDSSNNIVFLSSGKNQTSYIISVLTGTYSILVEAVNSTGDVIGTGSATTEIKVGQTNTVSITVSELAGDGAFSIHISANAGYPLKYSIRNASGSEVAGGSLAYSEGVYSASETLANGFYSFEVRRTDTDKVIKSDTLRIIKGKAVAYDATFQFLTDGSIVIVNEIITTPSIKIQLNAKELKSDSTLTVSAIISGISDYSCYWIVDNEPQSAAGAYTDFEMSVGSLEAGEHSIALFVTNGSIMWSESAKFTVLSDRPTSISVGGTVEVWIVGDVLIPESSTLEITCSVNNQKKTLSEPFVHGVFNDVPVDSIMSCELSNDEFYYYLESFVDAETDNTVVYVVIDRNIVNPHYVNVRYDIDSKLNGTSSIGYYLDNNQGDMGLVVYPNNTETRLLKLEGGTYHECGHAYCDVPDYIRLESGPEQLITSVSETVTLTMKQIPYSEISISIPDVYSDGTVFYGIKGNSYWGKDYSILDGSISMGVLNGNISYMLYPKYDKDCYYTVEAEITGESNVLEAVKHESSFVDSGISVPAGIILLTYSADVLLPSEMKIQCRIGEFYSSGPGIGWGEAEALTITESSELEFFCTLNDEYTITVSANTTTINDVEYTLIVFNITQELEEYASVNVTYDFDYDVTDKYKCAVMLNDFEGNTVYLPVAGKDSLTIKVKPGTYYYRGVFSPLWTESGERSYPYISPRSIVVHSGDTVGLSVLMENWD